MSCARINNAEFSGIRDMGIEFRDSFHLDEFDLAKVMSIAWKAHWRSVALAGRDSDTTLKVLAQMRPDCSIADIEIISIVKGFPYAVSVCLNINVETDFVTVDNDQLSKLVPMKKEDFHG